MPAQQAAVVSTATRLASNEETARSNRVCGTRAGPKLTVQRWGLKPSGNFLGRWFDSAGDPARLHRGEELSYSRNKRKKMRARERKFPHLFAGGVPVPGVSWNKVGQQKPKQS